MHLLHIHIVHARFPTRQHYPFNLTIMHRTDSISFTTPITFFVGENGTGKSTLLKAIAMRCGVNMWQGEKRFRRITNPFEERLFQALDPKWANGGVSGSYFDSQVFRHFAQILDDWAANDPDVLTYFGGKSLIQQSHGQSIMSFFKSRFRVEGLYLLDEPETALSPRSQLELLKLLSGNGRSSRAQFIIATQSPILSACPNARILSFDHAPVGEISYEETDAYRIYHRFLQNRTQFF